MGRRNMVKRALYDYIACFRWRNFVDVYKKSMLFIWIAIFNLLNTWNSLWNESKSGVAIYFVWASIFFFGLIGMAMCPMKLPKIMFLSPMNESQRRQYIKISFWVRIIVPTLIGILVGVILTIFEIIQGFVVILSVINLFAIFIFYAAEPTTFDREQSRRQNVKTNFFSVAGTLYSVLIQIGIVLWADKLEQGINECHYIMAIAFFIMGIMVVVYLKKLPKRLAIYAVYEEYMSK